MIEEFKLPLILLGFLLISFPYSHGESSTCLTVYKEGGAPAVFHSPKCPRWTLSTDAFRRRTENCQSAMLQGRRNHQEDRTFCALDVRIPFPGRTGLKEVTVGLVAVFDGHNGFEASEMASKLLLEYFSLHVYFLLDGIYSFVLKKSTGRLLYKGELGVNFQALNRDEERDRHYLDLGRSKWMLPEIFDGSFHMEILKESLLRAIHDIDTTFSKEALRNNLDSGSTATIVLIVDGQVLVANVGDSKALLCTEKIQSPQEARGNLSKLYRRRKRYGVIPSIKDNKYLKLAASDVLAHFFVKELTRDHHPDRDDERSRVEAAGGFVVDWGGVPRVNGELAVSRAIGDVSYKSYGVIPAPEVTDWQPLTANDSYLVVASDGIFEKLTTQDLCDLLWDVHTQSNEKTKPFSSCMYSLADCIVNTAFEKGSMDNMAVVVVPLRPTVFSGTLLKESCDGEESIDFSAFGSQKLINMQSANIISSGLVSMEYDHQVLDNFNRLLVEGTDDKFGCFYLSENLNGNMDYASWAQKDIQEDHVYDLPQALPEALGNLHSGSLNLYNDQNLCLHFGMDVEGEKGQCINPEGFSRFLGLLESIPFPDTGSDSSESSGYATPDSRYVLKRRFDRGSYGEVWLAFHWNCSQGSENWIDIKTNCSVNKLHLDPYNISSQTNSSDQFYHSGPCDDNLFILKRIMVERGTNVYLSGLREKYFGEVFLNASVSLGGLLSSGLSNSLSKELEYESYDKLETNKSVLHEIGYRWNPRNIFTGKLRMQGATYEEGLKHIARYVESFESRSKEIWLVFRNEGVSLSKLMYTTEEAEKSPDEETGERVKNVQVLHPSTWWHWLRTTEAGKEEMRSLIWQLLMALKSCHDRNITHRDIKPENMVICFEDEDSGRCLKRPPSGDKHYHIKMRIIDFGSAFDQFTIRHLYGLNGPSSSEQTYEYTPPEALLNASWFQGPTSVTLKYDMWSVGVVILELILGSPHVFQINARTRALLDQHLEGWNEGIKELAYKLRSFMEMCILIPGSSTKHHQGGSGKDRVGFWPASWKCSEDSFSHQVKSRDPLKLGFPDVWALRLVRQLLLWDPEDRLSVDDALQHPYFQPPPKMSSWA